MVVSVALLVVPADHMLHLDCAAEEDWIVGWGSVSCMTETEWNTPELVLEWVVG